MLTYRLQAPKSASEKRYAPSIRRQREERDMGHQRVLAALASLVLALCASLPASAQKQGGILKLYNFDSPPSMSILEEATGASQGPTMGIFNNLVMYDQHVKQNSLQSIVPDLATGWTWNEDGTAVTFSLRQGVKWHDGKPFTSADVVCTWDLLMEKANDKLRISEENTAE